ncbi:MAG: nucleoside deaminase [Anaerolineae bacterium]|nr:nucleoside deaminase [Anaerolineae bacterium]
MQLTEADITFFERAIQLAHAAEAQGNLPIGAVICYEGRIIAEGQNTIWQPVFNANRHAEIEALRSVPPNLWPHADAMTLHTTLEPCMMCTGAILLHRIGRVLYGTADHFGGASMVIGHMPAYFEAQIAETAWIGPAYPARCDPLHERVMALVGRTRPD